MYSYRFTMRLLTIATGIIGPSEQIPRRRPRCRSRGGVRIAWAVYGFTLIELLVTLAVAIILTMTVVPTVQGLMEKQRLSAAVEAVQGQLVLAKSEAAKRSQEILVSATPGDSWDVTLAYFDQVTASTFSRSVDSNSHPTLSMTAVPSGGAFAFDPVRGTATPGRLRLASANHQVDIQLDLAGRLTLCSPSFGRYPTCP